MDNLFFEIKKAQAFYPRLFASRQDTQWGTLFYNPRNTLSIEANHGVLTAPTDYRQALLECKDFYEQRDIPPRLYCYLPREEETALQAATEALGGNITKSGLRLLTCRNPRKTALSTPLAFEHIKEWDSAINQNIIGENLHLEGLLRGSMRHDTYTMTVGYLFGTPVTMAGIWDDGRVMRISNVMTGENFRGCGFAGALILHQLSLAAKKDKPAYLFADNPAAIRIYERDGMAVEDPGFGLYILETN